MTRLATWVTLILSARAGAEVPSFPGAEGYGATTPGGRGGRVVYVTSLEDDGPGSLRAACATPGPRIVLFRVAGAIALKKPIVVREPYLSLAGHTAPGDGVCLRGSGFAIATHDVVVRHLRSRLGDVGGEAGDGITLRHGSRRIVLDHCSATWSVDEALSLAGDVADVTVQWCLIAESLKKSVHPKGPHGYGSLCRASGGVSLHHNLWAHNDGRNPRLGDNYGKPPSPRFDVRNNVVYDYGATCSGMTQGIFEANYVGNVLRPGPSSRATHPIKVGGPSDMVFFVKDNVFEGHEAMSADNTLFFDPVEIDGKRQVRTVAEPFAVPPVQTASAPVAYEAVLKGVGAVLPRRDAVDARIVANVRKRAGKIIDSQQEVGGWPEYRGGRLPDDTDGDGMPDKWERKHRLEPRNPEDAARDRDSDGYTNVEEYLNERAGSR